MAAVCGVGREQLKSNRPSFEDSGLGTLSYPKLPTVVAIPERPAWGLRLAARRASRPDSAGSNARRAWIA